MAMVTEATEKLEEWSSNGQDQTWKRGAEMAFLVIYTAEILGQLPIAGTRESAEEIMALRLLRLVRLARSVRMIKQIRSIFRLAYGLTNESKAQVEKMISSQTISD
ncbi:hypothetical protein AK812_SmicGene46720 [Symbiodinium microadriaticum]|uniref:Uncharacterized protein n=1 Tax=Symbiodinium microadriaticum TaxID=2951 RepID=A0A1Q9BT94_SYMMI|nr:hypothetical protein AK812_SmicGene46720 [Symbiodinium microadriaticum]